MNQSAAQLGSFAVKSKIGSGGMADVWLADDLLAGGVAAVKVMRPPLRSAAEYKRAFVREVQAIGKLRHPSIVDIYDFGELSTGAAERLGKEFEAGFPWLAMELATASLAEVHVGNWPTLQRVLLQILDALAHAHARGILHRDLKPQNVLISMGKEGEQLKLADFGLAHPMTGDYEERRSSEAAGTPLYMSPEQFIGRWREFGPWTDLYALGCIAFQLSSGVLPYEFRSVVELAQAHRHSPIPPLAPRFAVPERFEQWVRTLLAKSPSTRFQRAADAAAELQLLGDVESPERSDFELPNALVHTLCELPSIKTYEDYWAKETLPLAGSGDKPLPAPIPQVEFPSDWHYRGWDAERSAQGIGLFGLREIPFVGREEERDILWGELGETVANGGVRTVLLEGPTGVGTSRLASWLASRAHELGLAEILTARRDSGTRRGALGNMFADYLACLGLSGEQLAEQVRSWFERGSELPEHLLSGLVELMDPGASVTDLGPTKFRSPAERYHSAHRLLGRIAERRPAIIIVDDAQWSADLLAFIRRAQQKPDLSGRGLLFLVCVRSDMLETRPRERTLLVELRGVDSTQVLALDPLDGGTMNKLINSMLRLEPQLAEQTADRADGNPLFALQLVGDWVQRGALRQARQGWKLDSQTLLPNNIDEVWESRIGELTAASDDESTRSVLEVAAAIGDEFSLSELVAVSRELSHTFPDGVLEMLVSRRLATRTGLRWSFVHASLREHLVESAKSAGRWTALNLACAGFLTQTSGDSNKATVALHLLEAGRLDDALPAIFEAVQSSFEEGRQEEGEFLLERADDALDEDSPAQLTAEIAIRRARLAFHRGDYDYCRELALAAAGMPVVTQTPELLGLAHKQLADLMTRTSGSPDEILSHYRESRKAFLAAEQTAAAAGILRDMAFVELSRGKIEQARELATAAIDGLDESSHERATAIYYLGLVESRTNTEAAKAHLRRAGELAENQGYPYVAASSAMGLATLHRQAGRLDSAREEYERAADLLGHIGANDDAVQLSMATLDVLAENFRSADVALRRLEEKFRAGEAHKLTAFALAWRLPCIAQTGPQPLIESTYEGLRGLLSDTQLVSEDIARPLELAAASVADEGLASELRDLVGAQREALKTSTPG